MPNKQKQTNNTAIPEYLTKYLFALKISKRSEIYETICLAILNNIFLENLTKIVKDNLRNINFSNKEAAMQIKTSKEFQGSIDLICKSNYFVRNFTKEEIDRKRKILDNFIIELLMKLFIEKSIKIKTKKKTTIIPRFQNVIFPTIKHKLYTKNNIEKIQLTFDSKTPLKEIENYLTTILKIKNYPKRKKLTLGKSIRILQVANDIKLNPNDYQRDPHMYTEQVIAREMLKKYNEEVSMETVNKALSRIKKIKTQINTIKDK